MTRVFVPMAILFALATPARAAPIDPIFCAEIHSPPQLASYEYAKATLVSLWHARNGAQRAGELQKELKDNNYDTPQILSAILRNNKISTNDFVCAKRAVAPFASSGAIDASALATSYAAQIAINRRLVDFIENIGSKKTADLMREMARLEAERSQRFSDLVKPTGHILQSLVNQNRTDLQGLIVTKTQKHELLKWANEHFVEFTNATPRNQWADPAQTAHMYFDVLRDRKGSDE